MSEPCLLNQPLHMKKRQLNEQQQEHQYFNQFFFPYSNEKSGNSNLIQETPTPGYSDETTIFDMDQPVKFLPYFTNPSNEFSQNNYQTLPYENNLFSYQECDYNFFFNHNLSYQEIVAMHQEPCNFQKQQIDDDYEHQKDSDQSTDAQIQSQQDNNTQIKEKVKINNDSNDQLHQLLSKLHNGVNVAEDDILQLNDAERAIFYSIQNKHPSESEMITPSPFGDFNRKEDSVFQNQSQQDLLHLDEDLDGNKIELTSSQLSNEVSDQSQPQFASINSESHQKSLPSKKQKKNNSSANQSSQSSQNNQPNKKKAKRVEEMQKMVFKKSFKYVETQYFRERIKKTRISSKDKDYHKFYEFYFSQASQENKIPLKNFFHPQKQIKKGAKTKEDTPGQKSFNQAYISLILKSNSFREKVEYYINHLIQHQIQEERDSKITKVIANMKKKYIQIEKELNKKKMSGHIPDQKRLITPQQNDISNLWESAQGKETFQSDEEAARIKSQHFSLIVSKLEDYIQTNSKLKLPWTDSQIDQAIILAKQTIIQLTAN